MMSPPFFVFYFVQYSNLKLDLQSDKDGKVELIVQDSEQ